MTLFDFCSVLMTVCLLLLCMFRVGDALIDWLKKENPKGGQGLCWLASQFLPALVIVVCVFTVCYDFIFRSIK